MQSTRPIPERVHGTAGGYTNWNCRCDSCRDAFRVKHYEYMQRRKQKKPPADVHGTQKGYEGWGCRCQPCREARGQVTNQARGQKSPYMSRADRRKKREIEREEAERRRAERPIVYNTAHQRVRNTRGAAKDHTCEFCGAQAQDWSLKADAKGMIVTIRASGTEERYSGDPMDYRPLCRPCHANYDRLARFLGPKFEKGCS